MEAASEYFYLKKQADNKEEDKNDDFEVLSDELNDSFDSDDEDQEQDFMFMNDANIDLSFQLSNKNQSNQDLLQNSPKRNQQDSLFSFLQPANTNIPFPPPAPPAPCPPGQSLASPQSFPPPAPLPSLSCLPTVASSNLASSKPPTNPVSHSKPAKVRYNRQGRKFKHEVDTNVICLKLKVLKDDADVALGDPVFCQACKAVFNMYSRLSRSGLADQRMEEIKEEEEEEEDGQVWTCEFCGGRNKVELEKEEMPVKNAVNYVIESGGTAQKAEKAIVFWVDVSGSMCVTKAVKGRFKIKGDRYEELQELMKFSDGSDQFAFNDKDVTYVSRLQCVQAAIEAQLIEMKTDKSKRKVGLVSFNGDVTIYGDGTQIPQTISGDKLKNYEYLLENGQKVAKTHMENGIDQTEQQLNEKLFALEEGGPTALGPAVVSAIAMAGECGNGSSVVICTDGLANIGVGCLEEQKEGDVDVSTFYEQLAAYAYEKGVTVHIISIKGEECDLETLTPLYDKTGGNVEIIEPDELMTNFANMFKKEIIATKVLTKIKLHKALEFRNEDPEDLNEDRTMLTRDIGNVTEDSEITFEYRVKNKEDLDKLKDFDINKLEIIPFQTIIEYTKLDGMKCIRTLTQVQKVTDNAEAAREKANIELLAVNAAQQASKIARKGNFREAQAYSVLNKKYIKSNLKTSEQKAAYSGWKKQMNEVYDGMHIQNNMEEMVNEQMVEEQLDEAPKSSKKGFFSKLGDKLSKNIQKANRFTSNDLKKKE